MSSLVAFKRLHDDNVPLEDAMPEFVAKRPARYRGKRLKDLCGEMHAFFRESGVSQLQMAQFAAKHLPEPAMTPREASRQLVRNNVDYLPLAELDGRIATTLWVVYPPGIATIVPGERLTERAGPMIDYLKMFEKSANVFPGFEAEVQGLYREVDSGGGDQVLYLCRERVDRGVWGRMGNAIGSGDPRSGSPDKGKGLRRGRARATWAGPRVRLNGRKRGGADMVAATWGIAPLSTSD